MFLSVIIAGRDGLRKYWGFKMITPVFVPMMVEDDKCPQCGKDEERMEVCKHCGYKYKHFGCSLWGTILMVLTIFFLLWIFMTLIVWGLQASFGPASLTDILSSQFQWLCNLRI